MTDHAAPSTDLASVGSGRPAVAGRAGGRNLWLLAAPVLLGAAAFLWLSAHRGAQRADARTPTSSAASAPPAPAPPPPPELNALEREGRGIGVFTPPPPVAVATPPYTPPPAAVTVAPAPVGPSPDVVQAAAAQRRRAPSLVVDLGGDGPGRPATAPGADGAGKPGAGLSADEAFAARADAAEPDRSRAVLLRNKATVIPQGAMIPAVLETALNSDLPGFTRAVVSRDVRSFDGSTVLIPRGSRVIGQYRSGLALGSSRAFVIWTRVLRPDGASIQIGSNGTDELGRAGLAGKVDRHFFERFSGAVLLSAITLGQAALTSGDSTQVVIGSPQDAGALASSAGALAPQAISPTIKVPQGSPIRIFVARDLDFTPVEDGGT